MAGPLCSYLVSVAQNLGAQKPRKTSDNLYHPSGQAAVVRRLASPLLLSPGVWEDIGYSGDPLEDCSILQYC